VVLAVVPASPQEPGAPASVVRYSAGTRARSGALGQPVGSFADGQRAARARGRVRKAPAPQLVARELVGEPGELARPVPGPPAPSPGRGQLPLVVEPPVSALPV